MKNKLRKILFSIFLVGFAVCFLSIVFESALAFDQNLFCTNLDLDFAECSWAMGYIENNSEMPDCPDCISNCSDPVNVTVESCNVSEIVAGLNFSYPLQSPCADVPDDFEHFIWLLAQKGLNFSDMVDQALNPVLCLDPEPCAVCDVCADCTKVVDKFRCTDGGGSWDGSSCTNNNPKVTNFDPMTGAATTSAPSTTPASYSKVKNRNVSTFVFFGIILLVCVYVFYKYVKPFLNKRKSRSSYGKDTPNEGIDPSQATVKEEKPKDLPDYKEQLEKKKSSKTKSKKKLPLCLNKKCKAYGNELTFDRSTKSWYCEKCKFEVDD